MMAAAGRNCPALLLMPCPAAYNNTTEESFVDVKIL